MRGIRVRLSKTDATNEVKSTAWIPVNPHKTPFSISCFTETVSGTPAAITISYTVDELQDSTVTPAVAGTVSSNLLSAPATGVKFSVATTTNLYELDCKLLQAG